MIQKQLFQNPDQKLIPEFNALDFRNILEEMPFPVLLINTKTGQVVSANHLISELVQTGFVEITEFKYIRNYSINRLEKS